jgi:renin receptor
MKASPAFINVRLSMKSLSKTSSARSEANKLFIAKMNKLNEVVQKKYDGQALFAIVAVDEHIPHHARVRRQAKPLEENETNPYNIASLSGADYPVIFNIIFWFSLVIIFALIAISLALANVEDKDSIIYRMTGARGKKDN